MSKDSITKIMNTLHNRFTSSNDVTVERATIKRDEWKELKEYIKYLEVDNEHQRGRRNAARKCIADISIEKTELKDIITDLEEKQNQLEMALQLNMAQTRERLKGNITIKHIDVNEAYRMGLAALESIKKE